MNTAMQAAFSAFEQAAFQNGNENAATIQAAQIALNTAMGTAFNTFTTDIAVSDARILTLITNICTALYSNNAGYFATCMGNPVGTGGLPASYFKFYDQSGATHNWPINMVVLTDWATANKAAGGSLTYTRDTTAMPAAMIWYGTCSVANKFDSNSCTVAGGTWTLARTCYGTVAAAGEAGTCWQLPPDYASLKAIQQDVHILQMTRWEAIDAAGGPGAAEQAAEQAFTDKLYTTITGLIGGTNGTTNLSTAQKKALVTLMSPPNM